MRSMAGKTKETVVALLPGALDTLAGLPRPDYPLTREKVVAVNGVVHELLGREDVNAVRVEWRDIRWDEGVPSFPKLLGQLDGVVAVSVVGLSIGQECGVGLTRTLRRAGIQVTLDQKGCIR